MFIKVGKICAFVFEMSLPSHGAVGGGGKVLSRGKPLGAMWCCSVLDSEEAFVSQSVLLDFGSALAGQHH